MGSRYAIAVSEQDIGTAERNISTHCAVAQAIYRNVPGVARVDVDIQTIRFSLLAEGIRRAYLTPSSVQEYIVAFDAGDRIEPFTFTLYRPAWESSTKVRVRARLPRRSARVYGRRMMRANWTVQEEVGGNDADER